MQAYTETHVGTNMHTFTHLKEHTHKNINIYIHFKKHKNNKHIYKHNTPTQARTHTLTNTNRHKHSKKHVHNAGAHVNPIAHTTFNTKLQCRHTDTNAHTVYIKKIIADTNKHIIKNEYL